MSSKRTYSKSKPIRRICGIVSRTPQIPNPKIPREKKASPIRKSTN
jgi:hypothetical protein